MHEQDIIDKLNLLQDNQTVILNRLCRLEDRMGFQETQMKSVVSIHPKILPKSNQSYGKLGDLVIAICYKYQSKNEGRATPYEYLYERVKSSALYSGKIIKKNYLQTTLHTCISNLQDKYVLLSTGRGIKRQILVTVYQHDE